MKKFLLFGTFALLYSGFALCASVTIVNSGFTFSPDIITINTGDTVNFQLGGIHNAVEVNETTWNANGNAPLDGGFSLPLGGGQVTGLTAGTHFYVCAPHASGGMKGKIIVNGPSGIGDNELDVRMINIYPNPTNGKFTLQFSGSDSHAGINQQANLEIFNFLGEKVYEVAGFISQTTNTIDLSAVSDGIYFVRINDRKQIYTGRIIKQ